MNFFYLKLVITWFSILSTLAQENFEGIIEYGVKFEMLENFKRLGISEEDFIKQLKENNQFFSEIQYYYRKGDYCIISKQKAFQEKQIYLAKTNLIYYFKDDLIITSDASIDLESLKGDKPKVELLEKIEKVNNEKCRIVKITWKLGTYYYYFKPEFLTIEPEFFEKHNYDMFNEYLKISKALPVKIIKEIDNFMKIEMTIKSHKRQKIRDSFFELPDMKENLNLREYTPSHQRVYNVQ